VSVTNGNGWEGRSDETKEFVRYHVRTEREHWTRRLKLVGELGAIAVVLVGGIAFLVGRASSAEVQKQEVRITAVEQRVESVKETTGEIKADVKELRVEQREGMRAIEQKIDAALDQAATVARRTGAPVTPRPPRAVIKAAPHEE
jgi:cell division protein FtsB